MTEPASRPPFRKHPYYYIAMKLVVLAAAVYFGLRLFGAL